MQGGRPAGIAIFSTVWRGRGRPGREGFPAGPSLFEPIHGIVSVTDSARRAACNRRRAMSKSLKSAAKTKSSNDLFGAEPKGRAAPKAASRATSAEAGYTAADIEVLEGLEPVRRRPGMYIGGTDEKALHHLFAEVIDNAMDEALAGHASFIEVELGADGFLTVTDNGRGIPVDPHPKFPKKSALEVIMCTLHSGGNPTSLLRMTGGL